MPVIRCELHKLLSNRLGTTALIAPIFIVALVAWLLLKSPSGSSDGQSATLRALQLSQIFPVIVGATITGQEYAESALRTSLLAVPRRYYLFWSKTVLVVGTVIISYLAALGVVTVVVKPHLTGTTILAAGASWVGLALVAAYLATTFRTIVVPLATMLPLILGLSMIIHAITSLARFLPDLSTMAVFTGSDPALLSPVQGGIVLATWVIVTGGAALTVLTRHDVR